MRQLWTALALGAAIAVRAPLAAQSKPSVERVTEIVPTFADVNPCNGESITLSGSIKTTVRIAVDANGVTHEATTVLARLEGTGETGAKYTVDFPEHQADSYVDGGDFHHRNYTLAIHYIGQGRAPNFISRFTMHFLILDDGTAKIDFEHVDGRCIGRS